MSTDLAAFDPSLPYRLAGTVSLRPETFGALVYDFATRRLSFLKSPQLVDLVRALADHPDARSATTAAGIPDADVDRYLNALAGLLASGTIVHRRVPAPEVDRHETARAL